MVIFCPKICRHKLVFSTSFCFPLAPVFLNLKDRAAFLMLIMHFSFVDVTWECLVFDFSFLYGIMSFYVSISDAVFLVTSFSIFDHKV